MKVNCLSTIFLAAAFSVLSCENTGEKSPVNEAADKMEKAVDNTVDKVKSKLEETFVSNVADNNAEEIEWLRAGTKMGTDPELIEIAGKMLPDHEKLAQDIKAYAASKKLKIDTENTESVKIDSKTGLTWDKKWAERIRSKHRDMVDKFERIQSNTEDPELKELVTNTLPMLREHLNMTEKLEARLSKATK